MARIDITIINVDNFSEADVSIDDRFTSDEIVQELINVNFLRPTTDPTRYYDLSIKGRNTIGSSQTLAAAGVRANDQICVAVSQRGGGYAWPDMLTIAAGVATIVQVVLMVADMWARKAEKKGITQAGLGAGLGDPYWTEVKEIHVLMSNGNRVQFNSWLADPGQVKDFLKIFRSSSITPKPISVTFILDNGSKVQMNVSGNLDDDLWLERFVDNLKRYSRSVEP